MLHSSIHIILDTATQKLTVFVDGDIEVTAKDNYDIQAEDILISASGDVSIDTDTGLVLEGSSAAAIVDGSGMKLQAPDVLIN